MFYKCFIILYVSIVSLNFELSPYSLKICNQIPVLYKIFQSDPYR